MFLEIYDDIKNEVTIGNFKIDLRSHGLNCINNSAMCIDVALGVWSSVMSLTHINGT